MASFRAEKQAGVGRCDQSVDRRLQQACEFAVGGLQELSRICRKVRRPTRDERTHTQEFDTRVRDVIAKGPLLTSGGQRFELQQRRRLAGQFSI